MGDQCRFGGAYRYHHEERDSRPGAEQNAGADHVQPAQDKLMFHQRSCSIAWVMSASTMVGTTLTSEPSGSAHSHGVKMLAAAR
jgi:hypothetical protein